MVNPLHRLSDRGYIWLFKKIHTGDFEGFQFSSMHDEKDTFIRVIRKSLCLVREHDPRRFRRVTEQVRILADVGLQAGPRSASYLHRIKVVQVDFEMNESKGDEMYHAAYYAGVIIHEATHGFIEDRGFKYTPKYRKQIERICCAEQNRFLVRLRRSFPGLPESMIRAFDPSAWNETWSSSRLKRVLADYRRDEVRWKRVDHGHEQRDGNDS